jgi:hypothetical protein
VAKDAIGDAIEAFFAGLIFIPIGAVLYSVAQNVATGVFSALLPAFFAMVELGETDKLAKEGIPIVIGWVFGLAAAVYFFPQYAAFGILSVLLGFAVLFAKAKEWI